ncbi:MAG: Ig-like domain-containing protein [Pseudomonadota bacterium]
MADLVNGDGVLIGDVFTLTGTGDPDTFTISGNFVASGGGVSGLIDGLGGDDTLFLGVTNLSNTTVTSIEFTEFTSTFGNTVDAGQIGNLGAISFSGSAAGNRVTLSMSNPSGATADFSGLTLEDGEELEVSANSLSSGQTLTVDFSGGTFNGTGFIDYNGNNGNETVLGGSARDLISGAGGDDSLAGGGGDDLLDGGSGTNTLRGQAGDDTLVLNSVATGLLDGGADADTIDINTNFQNGSIQGGLGTDQLQLSATNLSGTTIGGIEETIFDSSSAKTIDAAEIVNLGTTTFSGITGVSVSLSNGNGQTADFSGLSLADGEELTVSATGISTGATLTVDFSGGTFAGSSFIDFNGSNADETVIGGSGADEFAGSNGDDSLAGGDGDDNLNGGPGNNTLRGEGGSDTLTLTSVSTGVLDGGADGDTINIDTNFQNSSIQGGTGTDQLLLSSTNLSGTTIGGIEQTLFDNTGNKTIDAAQITNLGAISFSGVASSSVTLSNGDGQTADFGVTLQDGEELTVGSTGLSTGDSLTVDFTGGTFNGSGFIDFNGGNADETVIGGSGADELTGGNGDDSLAGGGGDDQINGGAGDNTLRGEAGNDSFTVGNVSSGLIDGGADNDDIDFDSTFQNSSVQGGVGTDRLLLSSTNLQGTTFGGIEQTLFDNTGAKTIDAAQIGNLGAISFSGVSSATVTLTNGNGQTADFNNLTLEDGQELTINTSGLSTGNTLTVDFSGGTFNGTGFVDFNGSNATETVTGGAGDDQISGGNGDDSLAGGGGNDQIDGGVGNNTLRGEGGNDSFSVGNVSSGLIDGGADNDDIDINSTFQNSSVQGGLGTDRLFLSSTSLQGTSFGGIEQTLFDNTGTKTIDAAQIVNLGTISFSGVNTATVTLSNGDGQTADFSGLTLQGTEELTVNSTGLSTGDSLTIDFSAGTFDGTSFIDFNGSAANETVFGGAGNDELSSSSGNDNLLGGLGADLIVGGSGDNSLFGGIGMDTLRTSSVMTGILDGGSENDLIEVVSTFQNSSIQGGTGTDTLELTNANLVGTTIGGIEATAFTNTGTKTIDAAQIVNLGTITQTVTVSTVTLSNGNGQTADFSGFNLADGQEITVNSTGLSTGNTIEVDFSAATFNGSSFVDFNGGNASETVRGGSGNDQITGGNVGTDQLFGGLGDDTLSQIVGASALFGGVGNDTLSVNATLNGATLDGGANDDDITISSTFTNGSVVGGGGNDTVTLNSVNATGTDFSGIEQTVLNNSGTKTLDAAEIANLDVISLAGNAVTSGTTVTLTNGAGETANFGGLLLQNNERITVNTFGQTGGETVTVDFSGGTFNGNSFITYNSGAANNVVSGGSGGDRLSGAAGDDILIGNGGNDSLTGNSGDNSLFGGAGADLLDSNTNSTGVLDGGADNDIIEVFSLFQNSSIQGGTGVDDLELLSANLSGTAIGGIENTFFENNGTMTVDADQVANLGSIGLRSTASSINGVISLTDANGETVDFSGLTLLAGEEFRIGLTGFGSGQSVSIDLSGATLSSASETRFDGTSGNETYQGGDGADSVLGNGGTDSLAGGAGNDRISGGGGDDSLLGELGNDTLTTGGGNDSVFGGLGNDVLNSNTNGSGLLDGGADDDLIDIFINFQNSSVQGGAGTDMLELNSANLTGTTIGGIEETILSSNGTSRVDAAQSGNLGAISLSGTAASNAGNLIFTAAAGQSVDLSGLSLRPSEILNISTAGASTGDTFQIDLSGATLGSNAQIDFRGANQDDTYIASSALEDVFGGSGSDTISYSASFEGVTVDLGAQTVTGGDAAGDTISSIENVIGSGFDDLVTTSSSDNTFFGGEGSDIFVVNGDSDEYSVDTDGATTVVTDLVAVGGNDGTDTLIGVEILRFNDADLAIGIIETPTISITADAVSTDEGDAGATNITFTLRRLGEPAALGLTSAIDFTVSPAPGILTAEASDFVGNAFPSGTVNFAADQTEATITVQVQGDTLFESDEEFVVTLSNPVDAVIGTESATTRIANDDVSETPLEVIDALDPANTTQIVAIAFDPVSNEVARYFSFASVIQILDLNGTLLREIPHPSEGSNDIDLTFAPEALTLGTTLVPAGSLLVINGESGTADIQAINPADGALIASLTTDAGAGSIVGGAYSAARDTFFLVNFSTDEILEIDPATGTTINSFDTGDYGFNFNFGDIEIDPVTGDILGVSSAENLLIRISPVGDLIDLVDLPDGVNSLSGIAPIDGDEALVSNTAGRIFRLGFFEAVPRLEISSNQTSRAEGDTGSTAFTFTVTRFGDLTGTSSATFTVETVAGLTDAEADDFAGGSFPTGTVSFAADQRTATITINVAGDTQIETNEMFRVVLSEPTGAIITQPAAVSQINNDDESTTPLSEIFRFDPEDLGQLVAVAFEPEAEEIAVYGSFATTISIFDTDGTLLREIPHPSEGSNDIDLEFAPEDLTLNDVLVPQGSLLVINGEQGTADIQAIDPADGTVLATLTTATGNGSIVGGAYNPVTDTFFLIDFSANTLVEISPADGSILSTVDLASIGFFVNFGDIDFDPVTGDFLVVSSQESSILRLSPDLELLDEVPLPAEVTSLSGIAGVDARDVYVSSTNGTVHRLGFFDPDTFPVAADDALTTDEDNTVTGNVIDGDAVGNGQDTDPENDTLSVIDVRDSFGRFIPFDEATSTGRGGRVTVSENGDITFDPNGGFESLDDGEQSVQTISYTVSDGNGGTDTATVTITVTGVNDRPVISDPGLRFVAENTTQVVDLFASDPDIEDLSFSIEGGADELLFDIDPTTGLLSFSDAPDFETPLDADLDNDYEVIVGASDGDLTGTQTITVRVTDVVEQGTLSIGDAAVTEGDAGTTAMEFTISLDRLAEEDVSFDVTLNNIDTDAIDFATGTMIGVPQTLMIATGEMSTTFTVEVQGDTDVEPDETFSVALSSITGAVAGDTIGVGTIVNDDEAAVVLAQNDALGTDEDTVLNDDLFEDNGNGPDLGNVDFTIVEATDSAGDTIAIGTQTAIAGGGLLTISADGTVIFDPNAEFEALGFDPQPEPPAEVSFSYTISNADGSATSTADVVIGITGVNDRPVATNDSAMVGFEGMVDIDVLTNDADVDDTELSVAGVIEPANFPGTLVINQDGTIGFTAAQGFAGDAVFQYEVADPDGLLDTATVTVTVGGPDDRTIAIDDVRQSEGDTGTTDFTFTLTRSGDLRPTDMIRVVTMAGTAQAGGDFLVLDEVVTFAPGQETATVTVSVIGDADVELDETFTVALSNEGPFTNLTLPEPATGTILNDDVPGNTPPDVTPIMVEFTEDDTDRRVNLLDPEAVSDADEDPLVLGDLTVTASDSRDVEFTVDQGVLTLSDGQFDDLNIGETVDLVIDYEVSDSNVLVPNTATITITGLNDAPVARPYGVEFGEDDETLIVDLLDPDFVSDVDNDLVDLSVTALTCCPEPGTDMLIDRDFDFTWDREGGRTIFAPGQFEDLAAGEELVFDLQYTISDNVDETDNVVTVTILGANDAPDVLAIDAEFGEDDAALRIALLDPEVVSDPDVLDNLQVDGLTCCFDTATGDRLVRDIRTSLERDTGILSIEAGQFDDLNEGEELIFDIEYTVTDSTVSVLNTVSVTITGVNDAPDILSEDAFTVEENTTDVGQVQVNDAEDNDLTFTIAEDQDGALFRIDETGFISFAEAPDFEQPLDAGTDNVYDLTVEVFDGLDTTTQSISVRVEDVEEGGEIVIEGTPQNDVLIGTDAGETFRSLGGAIDFSTGGGGDDIFEFGAETSNGIREFDYITDFGEGDRLDIGDRTIVREVNTPTQTILLLNGDFDTIVLLGVDNFDENQLV